VTGTRDSEKQQDYKQLKAAKRRKNAWLEQNLDSIPMGWLRTGGLRAGKMSKLQTPLETVVNEIMIARN
jgi:hypothetical protein